MGSREVVWLGDSKKKLKEFPEEVRKEIGYALSFVQDAKSGTYRVVYFVRPGIDLYVLHAFQKKSKEGISTPQKEVHLIEKRLKFAKTLFDC